ncbi:Uncharacterised protein [Prevotella nigrescens]|nr:Uncharacterised protein [Prevotella nigrescens]
MEEKRQKIMCSDSSRLPNKGDILFITGGEKDVLSLSAIISMPSVSTARLHKSRESIIESLLLRFRHIILLYDTDETGLREAERQRKSVRL